MRLCVDVSAGEAGIPWPDLHGAARGVIYALLQEQDPELATELHDQGWNGSSLRPVGGTPPLFSGTKNKKGVYTTSDDGCVWFGSPVPKIAATLLQALATRREIRWGRTALTVRGVRLAGPPDHSAGEAEFETTSPVIIKHEGRYLVPSDPAYLARLTGNIEHKADLLELPHKVKVEILDAGPRRRFDVQNGMRIGASVRLGIRADPKLLDALYDWGLGLNTNQAFGWIR